MTAINALVLTGYGLNCDHETAHAFTLAGAEAHRVHINTLIDGRTSLADYDILAFGGGFSWGDDHGAGVLQAVRMGTHLKNALERFIADGKLIIGICNGFQTLVNMGLLPGFEDRPGGRSVALAYNDCGNFRDAWVGLTVNDDSPCIFTRGLEPLELPVRHGEGKFVADPETIDRLLADGQVVLQYAGPDGESAAGAFPHNPNGSMADIAGICDPTGRIFGLMPHPEAYNHATSHPDWFRRSETAKRLESPLPTGGLTPGIRMFRNAVAHLESLRT